MTGKDPGEHYRELADRFGAPCYRWIDTPVTPEQKAAFKNLTPEKVTAEILAGDPVTERLTGLDLVALQLEVAEGGKLPAQEALPATRGHAIEVRLYAEDPLRDYLPATGRLLRFDVPPAEGLRVDAGFEAGSVVGPHYDSMLAKLIAWGPDRATAARRLGRAAEQAFQRAVERGGLEEPGNAWVLLGVSRLNGGRVDAAGRAFVKAQGFETSRETAARWLQHVELERERMASLRRGTGS